METEEHRAPPDFNEVCQSAGGVETTKGWEFHPFTKVESVAAKFGHHITTPTIFADRPGIIIHRGDCLILQVAAKPDDVCEWSRTERKNFWTRILRVDPQPTGVPFVRVVHFASEGGPSEPDGTYLRKKRGGWTRSSDVAAMRVMRYRLGVNKSDAERLMGGLHWDPWLRSCIPFEPEEPGGQVWNLGAPQLAYKAEAGEHPSWNLVFDHAGGALTPFIPSELKAAGISTGGEYLRAWFACILRDPACRLPYLFLFGDENCGKSILWEAFSLLVTGGVVKADRALNSDFNGELDGAILGVIEEKDVSHATSLPRIKDAVTGLTLAIRRMHTNQYQVPNYSHWLQTANSRAACLIPIGDTRFVAIHVKPLQAEVAKPVLLERLRAEAPAILARMLSMELPKPHGRLAMPVIDTPDKAGIQEEHVEPLAHKIIEFMEGRNTWEGTASELRDAIGYGPKNIAGLKNAVNRFNQYLIQNDIAVAFPVELKQRRFVVVLQKVAKE